VCFVQTNTAVSVRFTFFLAQLVCFLSLIVIIVRQAGLTW
jgi:hypothetical protein